MIYDKLGEKYYNKVKNVIGVVDLESICELKANELHELLNGKAIVDDMMQLKRNLDEKYVMMFHQKYQDSCSEQIEQIKADFKKELAAISSFSQNDFEKVFFQAKHIVNNGEYNIDEDYTDNLHALFLKRVAYEFEQLEQFILGLNIVCK